MPLPPTAPCDATLRRPPECGDSDSPLEKGKVPGPGRQAVGKAAGMPSPLVDLVRSGLARRVLLCDPAWRTTLQRRGSGKGSPAGGGRGIGRLTGEKARAADC